MILALALLLTGAASPQQDLPLRSDLQQSFGGRWVNAGGPVLTAIEIETKGPGALLHAWARCQPDDCDWGTTEADVYRSRPGMRGGAVLTAVFTRDGTEHRLILRASGVDRMGLEVLSRDPRDPARHTMTFAILARDRPSQAADAAAGPSARPVRVGGKIQEPVKVKDVRPVYPDAAKANRIQGLIVLDCTIGPDGSVVDVRPLRGEHQILIDAAIETVRQWRYTPTVVNGVAVPVIMTVTVNYKLS